MPSFPIRSGTVNVPAVAGGRLQRIGAVTIRNTSNTQPAAVAVTDSAGDVVYSCTLGPSDTAVFSGIALRELAPGAYTVAVVGSVTGTLATA